LTIVVPAYNEAGRIADTIAGVTTVARELLEDYEVIVVNDGSRDGTGEVARAAATGDARVRVVDQPANRGVGAAFILGLHAAHQPYITLVPGDGAFSESALRNVFAAAGSAAMVVSYRENMEVRTPLRRMLSVLCTLLMRLATGKPVRDAHSMYVFPVVLARKIRVQAGYGYHIEMLGRLLTICGDYVEVPALLTPKPDASSGVMRPRVLWTLGTTMLRLMLWRIGYLLRPNAAAEFRHDDETLSVRPATPAAR
jgi:glycosyltransferase involved in cell wall biosynthesis